MSNTRTNVFRALGPPRKPFKSEEMLELQRLRAEYEQNRNLQNHIDNTLNEVVDEINALLNGGDTEALQNLISIAYQYIDALRSGIPREEAVTRFDPKELTLSVALCMATGATVKASKLETDKCINYLCRSSKALGAYHNENESGRLRQRRNASKPRPNSLQELIIKILKKKPHLTSRSILDELRKEKSQGIIDDIDEDEILFFNKGKLCSVPISGLKDRVRRAKNYLKNHKSR
jgi:hypothetical protein